MIDEENKEKMSQALGILGSTLYDLIVQFGNGLRIQVIEFRGHYSYSNISITVRFMLEDDSSTQHTLSTDGVDFWFEKITVGDTF